MCFKKSDYHFDLPDHLIAKKPAEPRDSSLLLVVNRQDNSIEPKGFTDLLENLEEDSLLVINNTKVIPARLPGRRTTGGQVEALLIRELQLGKWSCLLKNSAKVKLGERLIFCEGQIKAILVGKTPQGECLLEFEGKNKLLKQLEEHAYAPLPPYILKSRNDQEKRSSDVQSYQTIFARESGAIAAPTAGLHLTESLLERLKNKLRLIEITLHVGIGTFEPIRETDIRRHQMHREHYFISEGAKIEVEEAMKENRKIIALGTTTARALESSFDGGSIRSGPSSTDIFIYPPYRFQVVDQLITNFHLPESSLLMLVSAFAGRELILKAYEKAVRLGFRFYSYGDAMLIL
ncbi:MAG: tRNA preQ1(34) S-adenosylmethionine ribosyltransferase-isomerase QueA [Deltaproteobacteria bacterium]|nr:tRNA preQ1(34) S-adenosylmethionine ribosyltransferase-isomerase QueA [Deltaproteobacteria bacterium]